ARAAGDPRRAAVHAHRQDPALYPAAPDRSARQVGRIHLPARGKIAVRRRRRFRYQESSIFSDHLCAIAFQMRIPIIAEIRPRNPHKSTMLASIWTSGKLKENRTPYIVPATVATIITIAAFFI